MERVIGNQSHTRTPRAQPMFEHSSVRATDRDRWLFEALAKMRFLTTSQLAKLFFGASQWAANKRLRKLLNSGLLKVWVRNLSEENIYSLTKKGLNVFVDGETNIDSSIKIPRGLDGNLEHLLAINTARVSVAVGLSEIGGDLIWWKSDWDLRAHGMGKVIPDALFAIRWEGRGEQTYSLEVDHHTKSPREFLKKIVRYQSLKYRNDGLYGMKNFLVLVVGDDPRWVERYRVTCAHARSNLGIWFTTREAIERNGVEATAWRSANGEENYSLRDLSFLPYGKECDVSENDSVGRG